MQTEGTLPRSQSRQPATDSHKTQNMLPVQYFNLHSRPIFIKYLNILNIFHVRIENCDVGMNLKKNYNRIRIELNIQTPTNNSKYLNIFIKHLPFIYIKYLSHHNTSTRQASMCILTTGNNVLCIEYRALAGNFIFFFLWQKIQGWVVARHPYLLPILVSKIFLDLSVLCQ